MKEKIMENVVPVLVMLLALGLLILAIVQLIRNLDSDQSGVVRKMNESQAAMVQKQTYAADQSDLKIRLDRLEGMIEPQRQHDAEVGNTLKSLNRDIIAVAQRVSEIPHPSPTPRPMKFPKTIQVEVINKSDYPETAPVVKPKGKTVLQEVNAKKKKK